MSTHHLINADKIILDNHDSHRDPTFTSRKRVKFDAPVDFLQGTTGTGSGGPVGDVVGPASSTDNALARFDLTTGKLLQDSTVTVDDAGDMVVGGSSSTTEVKLRNVGEFSFLPATPSQNTYSVRVPAATGLAGWGMRLSAVDQFEWVPIPKISGDPQTGSLATWTAADAVGGLAFGAANYTLSMNATGDGLAWTAPPSAGVSGPVSSVVNHVALWNDTSGDVLKQSLGVTIADSNQMAGLQLISVSQNTNGEGIRLIASDFSSWFIGSQTGMGGTNPRLLLPTGPGTTGQVLQSTVDTGGSNALVSLSWVDLPTVPANVIEGPTTTTANKLVLTTGTANTVTELAKGTQDQVLTANASGDPIWATPSGGGAIDPARFGNLVMKGIFYTTNGGFDSTSRYRTDGVQNVSFYNANSDPVAPAGHIAIASLINSGNNSLVVKNNSGEVITVFFRHLQYWKNANPNPDFFHVSMDLALPNNNNWPLGIPSDNSTRWWVQWRAYDENGTIQAHDTSSMDAVYMEIWRGAGVVWDNVNVTF